MNCVVMPAGTGWKALRSSCVAAAEPRPVAAMRYIAAEADESKTCVQPLPPGTIICTSNCSAVVMLPPRSKLSGVTAGVWTADRGSPLAVTEPPEFR